MDLDLQCRAPPSYGTEDEILLYVQLQNADDVAGGNLDGLSFLFAIAEKSESFKCLGFISMKQKRSAAITSFV